MTEEKRKQLNADRLLKVDTSIRGKVASCLATLEHYGHRPVIAAEVWRDPKTQLAMFRRGVSKVTWGFHCATTPDGKPASLAADIVDAEKAWNATPAFWLTLGYASKAQGLGWGGWWGLPTNIRKGIDDAFAWVRTEQLKPDGAKMPRVKFGWDQAHVEVAGISIAEARRGKRPK